MVAACGNDTTTAAVQPSASAVTAASTGSPAATPDRSAVAGLVDRYTAALNARDWMTWEGLLAAGFVDHSPDAGYTPDRAGFIAITRYTVGAFPNWRITNDDVLIDDSKVAIRFHGEGDNTGTPATGRHARVTGIRIFTVAGDRFTETWANYDQLGLYQQLGLIGALPGQSAVTPSPTRYVR